MFGNASLQINKILIGLASFALLSTLVVVFFIFFLKQESDNFTFNNETFGYSLTLPVGWKQVELNPLFPREVDFTSQQNAQAPLELAENQLWLNVAVRDVSGKTLDGVVAQTTSVFELSPTASPYLISERMNLVFDSFSAIRQKETLSETDGDGGLIDVTYIVRGSRAYVLMFLATSDSSLRASDETIKRIISNLRFIDDSNNIVVKTFTSSMLGITFTHAQEDLGKKIQVAEQGNTVYVYPEGMSREDGQYVRVFSKDPNATLQQTIQRDYLKGYNQTDCFVKDGTDSKGTKPASGIAAVIAYPISDTTNDQWLKNAEKCPKKYSFTNGLSYFWTDAENADRYTFFSIGQYYIPAESVGTSWHTTLEFIR